MEHKELVARLRRRIGLGADDAIGAADAIESLVVERERLRELLLGLRRFVDAKVFTAAGDIMIDRIDAALKDSIEDDAQDIEALRAAFDTW